MSTIEERTTLLEVRTDRLEVLFERFMEQTTASVRSIEQTIEEMKAEGARDRAHAARMWEEAARERLPTEKKQTASGSGFEPKQTNSARRKPESGPPTKKKQTASGSGFEPRQTRTARR